MKTQDKTSDELVNIVQEQNLLIDIQQDQIHELEDRLFNERLFRLFGYPIISIVIIALTVITVKYLGL